MSEANKISRELEIKPIAQVTLTDRVERRLIEYLQENNFQPGDMIPTEFEFADSLNVSRNIVREALSRLKMLGYVTSRKNKGMAMSYPDVMKVFGRVLDPLLMSKETQLCLMELRIVLEIGIAEILTMRKTPKDIIELEEILKQENVDPTGDVSIQNNIDFHSKLFNIANNEYIQQFHVLLEQIFTFISKYLAESGEFLKVSPVTHRIIFDELKNGTADSLRQAIRDHLQPHMDIILRERKIPKDE